MSVQLDSSCIARGQPCSLAASHLRFTSHGFLIFLFPDAATGMRNLFCYHIAKKELLPLLGDSELHFESAELSLTEQLRRERARNFSKGINFYELVACNNVNENRIMIPTPDGQIFVHDSHESFKPKTWVAYDGSAGVPVDPHISSLGDKIAFVLGRDMFYVNINESASESARRITTLGETEGVSCGLAEFIAQEEMDRYRGFWWSPAEMSEQQLLFTVVDERAVGEFTIMHVDEVDARKQEHHRYPFAGEANAYVRLAVVSVDSVSAEKTPNLTYLPLDGPDWLASAGSDEYYLARAGWWPHGSVMAQVVNRAQSVLQLLSLSPTTGARSVLITETCERGVRSWVNLHDLLHCFSPSWRPKGSRALPAADFFFLWGSERSGYRHVYLYHYNSTSGTAECMLGGAAIGCDERAAWVVDSIDGVDEDEELVYLSASRDGPTEKQLYRCSLRAGVSATRVSSGAGWHSSCVGAAYGLVADSHSSVAAPPTLSVYDLATGKSTRLGDSDGRSTQEKTLAASLRPPVFTTVPSSAHGSFGSVPLCCCVYKPDPLVYGEGPYPTVVAVYGGPCVQRVTNHWSTTADMRAQRLAQQGFLVIKCDNRGSSRRGCAFEGAIWLNMGAVEIKDQCTALDHFKQLGLADPSNVGIYGWSYGGYLSAMALCEASSVFKCACAGAPVTFWQGYDTFYTERYMSTPEKNPEGYRASAVMSRVANITNSNRLFIVHGLIDENVHIRHTFALANALNVMRIRYELLIFPKERHSPHGLDDKIYLEDRILDFFDSNLKPRGGIEVRLGPSPSDGHGKAEDLSKTQGVERIFAHL